MMPKADIDHIRLIDQISELADRVAFLTEALDQAVGIADREIERAGRMESEITNLLRTNKELQREIDVLKKTLAMNYTPRSAWLEETSSTTSFKWRD